MEKSPDYLVLVNSDHSIPEGFEETVEIIPVENAFGEPYEVERKTYEAFMRLREDLLTHDGIQTELVAACRSVEKQIAIFEDYRGRFGLDYANKYVAKPGHSEHHTGLAIDVGIVQEGRLFSTIEELLSVDHLFRAVQAKLPRYGFILRYPEGKKPVTGIGYEPWHFRYIDAPDIAAEITDRGICFEEYREKG